MSFIHCRLWLSSAVLGVALGTLGTSSLVAAESPAAMSPEWVAKWREDLGAARAAYEEQHPDPFHTLRREEWERELADLDARLPELAHHQAVVALTRIFARLGDGHTRLTLPLGPGIEFMQGHSQTPEPELPELMFHQFPLRVAVDETGVYVMRVASAHRDLLGGRIVRLGTLDIDAAIENVSPTIRRDNAQQVLHHLPMHLVLAEILHARGVIPDLEWLPLVVELPDGERREARLEVVPLGGTVDWADVRPTSDAAPLHRRHPERRFWLEALPDAHALYVQIDEVYDEEDETLQAFANRVVSSVEREGADDLILDLRNNRGGNAHLARPMLHALLCSPVNRTGHLFALVGRTTFSAAMMFALSLERHTNVLFVGEDTGTRPNAFGDSRKTRLPNTGITIRVSTRYHQYDFTDVRDALAPHIPVAVHVADDLAGRDPALEAVLDLIASRRTTSRDVATHAPGSWSGRCAPGLNNFGMEVDFSGDDRSPLAQLRIPALELDEAVPCTFDGATARVRVEFQGDPVDFAGERSGDWIVGQGSYRGYTFPFVLRRAR